MTQKLERLNTYPRGSTKVDEKHNMQLTICLLLGSVNLLESMVVTHLLDLFEILRFMGLVKFLQVDFFQVSVLLRCVSLSQRSVLAEQIGSLTDDLIESTRAVPPKLGLCYSRCAVGGDTSVRRLIVAEDLRIIVYDRLVRRIAAAPSKRINGALLDESHKLMK